MKFCAADDCDVPVPSSARRDALFCSSACRQRSYRRRRADGLADFGDPAVERALQEAELVNSVRLMVRHLLDPETVTALSPKAQDLLVAALEDASCGIRNVRASVTDRQQGDQG